MQIDTSTLTAIQEYRIETDPIVGNSHSGGPDLDTQITSGRRRLFEDTPAGERITLASWGELTELCSVASLTHAAFTHAKFVALIQYALREMLDKTSPDDHDSTDILPSNVPTLPADDTIRTDARELREALKRDHDRWFANHVDDLNITTDGVPDAFWLHNTTTTAADILVERYAAIEESDHNQITANLPHLPEQDPTPDPGTDSNADNAPTPNPEPSSTETDPAQAGLDMF